VPRIVQQRLTKPAEMAFKRYGIKIKRFQSILSFERELKKFLKRNHVLHLSTCKGNSPRSTPLEYRLDGFIFYVLSGGGGKFANLEKNNKVAFSIAEPYHSEEDFWGYKGLQGWGRTRIYHQEKQPEKFQEALKKMKIEKILKGLGVKSLPPNVVYKIIEIVPDRIRYGNPREGIYWTTWLRKG